MKSYSINGNQNWAPATLKKTSEGAREMVEMGEPMQARFQDLLPPVYSSTWYSFTNLYNEQSQRFELRDGFARARHCQAGRLS